MNWKVLFFLGYMQVISLFCFEKIAFIKPNKRNPTLINSVSFHPKKNLFCVTFTHHHQVGLYQITDENKVKCIQLLQNPNAQMSHPQNAIFSPNGDHLVIVNWSSRNLNIYSADINGLYQTSPNAIIPCHLSKIDYRPHGMCFSPDEKYFSVVYGSFSDAPWTVVLYRVFDLGSNHTRFEPCSSLEKDHGLAGVPKGVTFSPDGTSLIVTFTETNSVGIFSINLENDQINAVPKQELSGASTILCRPEDIAFSPDGSYCAVSNSTQNNVSFYQFDSIENRFITDIPFKILGNDNPNLLFPHGLAFSSDGKFFAVTQFGTIEVDSQGYMKSWGKKLRSEGVNIFRVN